MSHSFDQPNPSARDLAIMEGFPPPPQGRVNLLNWDRHPFNRWSFRNIRSVLPTRVVSHDPARRRPLKSNDAGLADLPVGLPQGQRVPLGRLLEAIYVDGMLVLHRGDIAFERYLNDMTQASLHLSQSVSKSFIGTLVGIEIGRGRIDPEAPVEIYVPELAATGYRSARIIDVLDMRSGVRFIEDYLDPNCEMGRLDRASGWKPLGPGEPASVYELVLTLVQDRPHRGRFAYRSIETDVLGWILERTTGTHLCDLLGRELWGAMGAEADAAFTVDPAGTALADGGLNATLRDYARFGLLMLEDGRRGRHCVIPADFVRSCRSGDPSVFLDDFVQAFPQFPRACYSRQWWVLDQEQGISAALGIFGQMVYIDRSARCVVVFLSSWPSPTDDVLRGAQYAAAAAVARALNS